MKFKPTDATPRGLSDSYKRKKITKGGRKK